MAGDWIKVEHATCRKVEVLRIASALSIHPDQALGLCIRFWIWCDEQLKDGHAAGMNSVTLDSHFNQPGLSDALITAGWLQARQGSLVIPNFDRHMSESAKNRALSGIRKKKQRHGNVTEMSRSKRDKSVTREEKRREEKRREDEKEPPNPLSGESGRKPPAKAPPFDPLKVDLPPSLESPEFRAAWADWMRHRMEIKKPYKPLGVEKLVEQLAAMGAVRSIAAINYSIANQWQGVFEPKSSDRPGRGAGSDPRGNISVVEEYLRDRRA